MRTKQPLTPDDARILYMLKMEYVPGLREESASAAAERQDFERMRALIRIRRQCRRHLNYLYGVDLT